MKEIPTPPRGKRWLQSTKDVWHDWHTTGRADDWTAADYVQATALLAILDDLARAASPTARVRLSNEVRQIERRLERKPPKRRLTFTKPSDSSPRPEPRRRATAEQELAPLWE